MRFTDLVSHCNQMSVGKVSRFSQVASLHLLLRDLIFLSALAGGRSWTLKERNKTVKKGSFKTRTGSWVLWPNSQVPPTLSFGGVSSRV